jgi:hypothetical protein
VLPLPPPNAPDLAALDQSDAEGENAIQDSNVPAEVVSAEAQEPDEAEPAEGGKKPRNAFNSIEIAAQIHAVQEWLTSGKRPNEIRRLCAQEWGLSTRVAETRMAMARRQMVIDANVYDRQEKVGQMLQQLEQVLEQALTMRQGSNAIGALRLQADLLQLLSRQN